MKTYSSKRLILTSLLLGLSQTSWAACDQTLNSGANITKAVSSAANGDTICLNAGSYSGFNGTVRKTSLTTVIAAPGLSNTQVTLSSVDVKESQYLAFVGMTIRGATISTSNAPALHIQFKKNAFTSALNILTPGNVNQDILIDGNTFIDVGQGLTEGRLGVRGFNNNTVNGVVISNNLFKGSGPSDGVQIIAGAYGTVIGPGNEFVGIKQSGCGQVHCDPVQFYGANNSTITGNYFHHNSTGLMLNGGDGRATITNNLFVTDGEYPDQIVRAGTSGDVISHNTFANGARMRFGDSLGKVTNATIKDNISSGLNLQYGQNLSGLGSISYNLISGSAIGTGGINGTPTYTGGSNPTTSSGYKLATNSKGYRSASDGKDMGAYFFTSGSTPTPDITTTAPPSNLVIINQ